MKRDQIVRWLPQILMIYTAMSVSILMFQNCGQFQAKKFYMGEDFLSSSTDEPTVAMEVAPPSLSGSRDATFTFVAKSNKYATIENISCSLDDATAVVCQSGHVIHDLQDGDHKLVIVAIDSLGNKSSALIHIWRIDATVPTVRITSAPTAIVLGSPTQIEFAASDSLSGIKESECSWDSQPFAACTSPISMQNLAIGSHGFKVKARDLAGNLSAEVSHTVNVATALPVVVSITQKPPAYINVKTAQFLFSGTDELNKALSSFTCQLDSLDSELCVSPKTYLNLTEGNHSFKITGKSTTETLSAPISAQFIVDTIAPSLPIMTTNIQATTNQSTAVFSFSATDSSGIGSFQCRIDDQAFATCTSPKTISGLIAGVHKFEVRALDMAGNTSPPAIYGWSVDFGLPIVTITSGPSATTTDILASFAFTASDSSGLQSLQCALDAGSFSPCTSPVIYSNLTVDAHVFRVRAIDVAGNTTSVTRAWTVKALCKTTATLTWRNPTTNTDGSPVDLEGIKVFYGTTSNTYEPPIVLNGNSIETHMIENLTPQTYYFAVKAFNANGDSGFSNEASAVVSLCTANKIDMRSRKTRVAGFIDAGQWWQKVDISKRSFNVRY